MEIKTINRIYDDNGVECCEGDTVLIQTQTMDDIAQASIDQIMTNMAVFIIDDRALGYIPLKVRKQDVKYITLYARKPSDKDKEKNRSPRY